MKFWKKSLMARLVSYFLLLSLITVGLVGSIAYIQARSALRQSIFSQLDAAAALKEDELNNWVEEQRREVLFLTSLTELRTQAKRLLTYQESDPNYQSAYAFLSRYLSAMITYKPDFQEIFILTNVGGKIVLSTDKTHEGLYRVSDNFFTNGRLDTSVQNVYSWPLTLKPTMTISTPLFDEKGRQTLGVLAVHLNLERMDKIILERTGLGKSGETYLVDQHNTFVSAKRFGRIEFPRGVHTQGIDMAVQKKDGSGLYLNYAEIPVIGVYRWLDDRELALLAEISQKEAFAPARRLAWIIILVGLVSAGILAMGVYLLSRQIAGPILAVADAAVRVADGDLNQTAPVLTQDETGVLAHAFNRMTGQLQQLYEALKRSEEHFRSLIENASDVIMVIDNDALIRYISPSIRRVLGYDPNELTTQSAFDFVHPDDKPVVMDTFRRRIKVPGVSPSQEFRARHQDGSWRIFEVIINNLLHDPVVAGIVVNTHDITRRKQLEKQYLQAQKMEAIGQLTGGIAHDINNVLTVILLVVELMNPELAKGSRLSAYSDEIMDAANHAADLIRQLLAFSRKQVLQPEILNLNDIVNNLKNMLCRIIGEHIEMDTILDPDLGAAKVDPGQMEQVLMNLAVNARDAMPSGGKLLIESNNIRLDENYSSRHVDVVPGDYIMVTVRDTGVGIDADTLSRIFEPFYTTKADGKGTGLGLATVHGIVKQSGGHISVFSEPGKGTSFNIYLPKVDKADKELLSYQSTKKTTGGTETVLVVEDDKAVRTSICYTLMDLGYQVLQADRAESANRVMASHGAAVDLLLTDLNIPGGENGIQLANRACSQYQQLKVLYMSGYMSDIIAQNGVLNDGLAFIQKPFLAIDLANKVRETLDAQQKKHG